jgi:translation initiation factor IF-2
MGRAAAVAIFAAGGFGAGGGFPPGGEGGAYCGRLGPGTVVGGPGAGGGFPLGGGGACGIGADICDAAGGAEEGGMELV